MCDDPYKVPESKPETSATIYWSIRSLPEVSGLSRAEQKAAWKACYRKAYGQWQFWLGGGIVLAVVAVPHFIARYLFFGWYFHDYSLTSLIVAVALQVFSIVVFAVGTMLFPSNRCP